MRAPLSPASASASAFLILALVLPAACSNASGTTKGGEDKFDAAPPVSDFDSGPGTSDGGGGITWTDIYRDYFGVAPPGPGCKGDGLCHGSPSEPGTQTSSFNCGATKDACYTGITDPNAALINKTTPATSALVQTLRHKNASGVQIGSMPKRPTAYFFSDADLKRIEDWMAAGAQNN